MIERARRESNAVKVVCGIGYEIAVRVLYQAGLHGSKRKEGFAMTQARFVLALRRVQLEKPGPDQPPLPMFVSLRFQNLLQHLS